MNQHSLAADERSVMAGMAIAPAEDCSALTAAPPAAGSSGKVDSATVADLACAYEAAGAAQSEEDKRKRTAAGGASKKDTCATHSY